jgi:hypothetical protein
VTFTWDAPHVPVPTPTPSGGYPDPPTPSSPSLSYSWELWNRGRRIDQGSRTDANRQVAKTLVRGEAYTFRVKACNSGACSPWGETDVAIFPRVFNVWGEALSPPGVRFIWGYEGMQGPDANRHFDYTLSSGGIVDSGSNGTANALEVSGLPRGRTYDLDVWATNHGCTNGPAKGSVTIPGGTIYVTVFRDNDGDGTQDVGEPVLPDIRVDVVGETHDTTDAAGRASFPLPPGAYTVEVDANDGDLPDGAVLTTSGSQSVSLDVGDQYVTFGFQAQGDIQGLVYLDADRSGHYDADDSPLENITVDIACEHGYGGSVETTANAPVNYTLTGMPAGTCEIAVDTTDADLPQGAKLVEGDNPASVTLVGGGTAGEDYRFEQTAWEGGTPSGEVFVHTYVPGLPDDQADYYADELIQLDIQRWAGLAPIFEPDHPPELCHSDTGVCETGTVMTERFVVEDIDGDGRAIENLTYGESPTFDYPEGREVVYNRTHARGDTNYDDEEHLWVIMLSAGGLTPDDGLDTPDGVLAVAEEGYPGTYQIEGTLHLRASWSGGELVYDYAWEMPIEFYITQRAPYPHDPQ